MRGPRVSYTIRASLRPPLAVTRRPRRGPGEDIYQIQWHATHGAAPLDLQVQATENWFSDPRAALDAAGQPRDWAASADFVLGPDRREAGALVIVQFERWWETWSSFSAGYGADSSLTLPAARYGVAIEVAQSAAFEPYSEETLAACVWLVGHINASLRVLGVPEIPAVRIASWSQAVGQEIPRGHIGHEDLANGRRLGKVDPGDKFPWDELMRRLAPAAPVPAAPTFDDGRSLGRREVRDAVLAAIASVGE